MVDAPKQLQMECEVESSGPLPLKQTFKNNPSVFPELKENLNLFLEQARIWGVRFPLIERIILHRSDTMHSPNNHVGLEGMGFTLSSNGEFVSMRLRYLLAVEVPGIDSPSQDEELLQVRERWQPDSLRALVENDFQPAFKDFDEWMIELVEPGAEIIEVIEGACWLLYEKTSGAVEEEAGVQKQGGEEIDDALKRAALELMPKIRELWSLILAGINEPLKNMVDAKDLLKVAIDILQDNPRKWLPIKEAHLKKPTLYNTAPDRAARTFHHNLLGVVLKSQGYSVRNSKKLWESLKPTL